MTVLTISHVTKQLERNGQHFTAIDDVSLKINAGHVLAILGPSGSGKSTLLRLAAGLLKPDSGQVLYDNEDLHSIKPKDRRIGMVFQDNVLVPHWQARESVGFFLKLRKRERELPERVKRISQITGIGIE
ncbi:MAG: sulfate ABC transporter ATP-binding protein, partial [Phototrophicales bacterium]